MEQVIFLWAPLAIGACWGAWRGRPDRLSLPAILPAPVVSAAIVGVAIVVVGVASGRAPANPANPNPLIVQWLAAVGMYGLGIFLFGAIPAVLGSVLAQACKIAVRRRPRA